MPISGRAYIEHILREIVFLEQQCTKLTEAGFIADDVLTRASVCSLTIIGEAARRVPDEIRSQAPGIEWALMAKMRDHLIHDYFGVDDEIVWDVIRNRLPQIREILQELQNVQNRRGIHDVRARRREGITREGRQEERVMNSILVPGSSALNAGTVRTAVITGLYCLGLTLSLPVSARGQHGAEFQLTVENGTPIGALGTELERKTWGASFYGAWLLRGTGFSLGARVAMNRFGSDPSQSLPEYETATREYNKYTYNLLTAHLVVRYQPRLTRLTPFVEVCAGINRFFTLAYTGEI